jgi:hypothetical protein
MVQEGGDIPPFICFYSQLNRIFSTKEIKHIQPSIGGGASRAVRERGRFP